MRKTSPGNFQHTINHGAPFFRLQGQRKRKNACILFFLRAKMKSLVSRCHICLVLPHSPISMEKKQACSRDSQVLYTHTHNQTINGPSSLGIIKVVGFRSFYCGHMQLSPANVGHADKFSVGHLSKFYQQNCNSWNPPIY